MGVLQDLCTGATAPIRGGLRVVRTDLENLSHVARDLWTGHPGKAIDHLVMGGRQQFDNLTGIPKEQWRSLKSAAGHLRATVSW